LHYLSFSFILKLLNWLKMFFDIDMAIQKVDESWFENRWVILLENYSINPISQLRSPFANFKAKNRQDEILELFIRPQYSLINFILCFTQFPYQKLSKRFAFRLLFQTKISSNFLSVLFDVDQPICMLIDIMRFS